MKTFSKLALASVIAISATSANATIITKTLIAAATIHAIADYAHSDHELTNNPCDPTVFNCAYYDFSNAANSGDLTDSNAGIDSVSATYDYIKKFKKRTGSAEVSYGNGLGVSSKRDHNPEIQAVTLSGFNERLTLTFENPTNINYFTLGGITGGALVGVDFVKADNTDGTFKYSQLSPQIHNDSNFYFGETVNSISFYARSNALNLITDFTVKGICLDEPAEVPVPAAAWLFGSALAGLVGLRRRKAA